VFIKSDCIIALIIVQANCVLNSTLYPVEEVICNHFALLTRQACLIFLAPRPVSVCLYRYLRNCLANCSIEECGYSLFSTEYVLLHVFISISTTFLIILGIHSGRYYGKSTRVPFIRCVILLPVTNFVKSSNIKYNENPSSGNRFVSCGRTDIHDGAS